jgi:hypothetical protein
MTLRQLWRRITTTRYTRALEGEVARLRAENRALLNSILGIAGVPPLPVVAAPPLLDPRPQPAPASVGAQSAAADARHPASGVASHDLHVDASSRLPKQSGGAAIPMRRRSWQQINRMLEFEATKKKDANAAT